MIVKKICLLGAYAVGKTSLVRRFVTGQYSDRYLTTVGVKIDRKELVVAGNPLTLYLWDLHGEDEFQSVEKSYLRGAAAFLVVLDPTRAATLDTAVELQRRARVVRGDVPRWFVLNKADLEAEWEWEESSIDRAMGSGSHLVRTSAKTGAGVEAAFRAVAEALV
jgi:small GTP-binding protein